MTEPSAPVETRIVTGLDLGTSLAAEVGIAATGNLPTVLRMWVEATGTVVPLDVPDPFVRGLLLGRWQVRIEAIAWSALSLVPLLAIDSMMGTAPSASSLHGLLDALRSSVARLSDEERLVIHRILDQTRGTAGATVPSLATSLAGADREVLVRLLDDLVRRGVVEREGDRVRVSR